MQIHVDTDLDESGAEKLRRLRFDGRIIEVADTIDQWHGAGYRYVKVRDRDGDLYILRLDEIRGDWGLTMYQRHPAQAASATAARSGSGGEEQDNG